MPRPARFDLDQILDAALSDGRVHGFENVSASRIAKHLNAPSGSIYHRYKSRDGLMQALWVRTIKRFQAGVLDVLANGEPALTRAIGIAHYVIDWTANNRAQAELLTRYRHSDLLKNTPPAVNNRELKELNTHIAAQMATFAAEFDIADARDRVRFACVATPMAAARELLDQPSLDPEMRKLFLTQTVSTLLTPEIKQ